MEAVLVLRQCSRCSHDLTDAVSIEHGLGPECRGKANEILAKEIPAQMNPDRAFLVLSLAEEQFPEAARESFRKSYAKLLETKAFAIGEGAGQDVRSLVRELAWLLSWEVTQGTRYALLEAIKGLGYVAYAGYLEKKASASAATVTLRGERLYLKAVRNGAGTLGMRLIWGRQFHSESEEWSVPLEKAEELFAVVRRCWPLTDLSQAEADVKAAQRPKAFVATEGDWLIVETPYHREAINGIKALPTKERWWDGKAWHIRKEHQAALTSLLSRFFRLAA